MDEITQLKASAFDTVMDGLTPHDIDSMTGLGLDVAQLIKDVSSLGKTDFDTFEEYCERRGDIDDNE